jgi:hypothetical protein
MPIVVIFISDAPLLFSGLYYTTTLAHRCRLA